MERIVTVSDTQIGTTDDLNAIGEATRESLDHVVGDAVGAPHRFAGFTVSILNQQTVSVAPGRYYKGDRVYNAGESQSMDLALHLPAQSNLFKWVALVLRGQDATVTEQRQFETDVDTGELTSMATEIQKIRVADLLPSVGIEGPTPLKPTIAVDQAAVAYIKLGSTGVVEIERAEEYRLKSAHELEVRISQGEELDKAQGSRIGSIETDLSNVSNSVSNVPRPEVFRQQRIDIAKVLRRLSFPDAARATMYDYALVKDQWDYTHPSWYARIAEGVRFSAANEREADMVLDDPADPSISVTNNLLLPAYGEKTRIAVEGRDSEVSISNITHSVTTAIKREISRSSVSYGPTFNVCENRKDWAALADRRPGETFANSGETFNVVGLTNHVNNSDPTLSQDHKEYAVRAVTHSSWTEVRWDYVTSEEGLSGSIFAQTFLNAQPGWMTSLELNFSRTGEAEDVKIILMETNLSGEPDLKRVIESTTIPHAALKAGWNKAVIRPAFLELGKLYAWAVVTTGNHWLATVTDNKFAQGSKFHTTDGVWFQGSVTEDFPFRVNFAHFEATRVVVPFDPMTLENGIGSFKFNFGGWVPAGTRLQFEIRPSDADVWYPIANYDANLLNGLPALCRYRAVFVGTTDLMPGMDLSQAKVTTIRPANTFTAVSDTWAFGLSSDQIIVEATLDTYDQTLHTFTPRLIANAVVEEADTITVVQDPDKPDRRTVRATFNLPAAVADCRLQLEGDTTSVVAPYFIQDVIAFAL